MKPDPFVKALLLLTTLFLGLIALRPLVTPPKVRAQSEANYRVYIEPGTTMLITPDGRQNFVAAHGLAGEVGRPVRFGQLAGWLLLAVEAERVEVVGVPDFHPIPDETNLCRCPAHSGLASCNADTSSLAFTVDFLGQARHACTPSPSFHR